jgi:hypothetical protein
MEWFNKWSNSFIDDGDEFYYRSECYAESSTKFPERKCLVHIESGVNPYCAILIVVQLPFSS